MWKLHTSKVQRGYERGDSVPHWESIKLNLETSQGIGDRFTEIMCLYGQFHDSLQADTVPHACCKLNQ